MRSLIIIEDESDIANLLAARFAAEGFRVATASDGRSGIRAIQRCPPHLIILDLLLPEMSGWDVVRALKGNLTTHAIPIIVLSAISTSEDRIGLLEAGIDDFIVKPCNVKEVVARARAVLRRADWSPTEGRGRDATDGDSYGPYRR